MLLQGCQASPQGGAEETIVTDLHKALRQDMLQKTMNELLGSQGTTFFCAGLGVAIPERHTIPFQLQDPVVANGDPENVRGQILQGIQTRANRFTVYDPRLLPNVRRKTCITIGATQRLLQFATENPGERSHRQQEVEARR